MINMFHFHAANIIYSYLNSIRHLNSFNQDAKLKLVYKAANGDEYWLTLISLNLSTKFPRERA